MSNQVYANDMEVSCKQAAGKSICAFPDVCMTPPQTPATPPGVPIPYPNTGMASDTSDGSTSVKISGQEVMLKRKSYFKKSMGDEAGCAPMKGVVTHKNTGKVYFAAWSMDVKVEGENVVRNLDLTTHNHASDPGQTPPFPYLDRVALALQVDDCHEEVEEIRTKCDPWEEKARCPSTVGLDAAKTHRDSFATGTPAREQANKVLDLAHEQLATDIQENECQSALRCALVPYRKNSKSMCCPGQTPDHLMPAAQFFQDGRGATPRTGCANYVDNSAPCMCAEGGKSTATHGLLGRGRKQYMSERGITEGSTWKMKDSAACGAKSANEVHPQCSEKCIEGQLKKAHNDMGVGDETDIGTQQENVRDDVAEFGAGYVGYQVRT
jgi:hypothetical protein